MPEIPSQIVDIAAKLRRGERVNRRKLDQLLTWFNAERRGRAVLLRIKEAFARENLETDPDFTTCAVDALLSFRLTTNGNVSPVGITPTASWDRDEPEPMFDTEISDARLNSDASDFSDDFLEPESDDEVPTKPDDRPVTSEPADWTIDSLRGKHESGMLVLQPEYQREYVWKQKPELPSRLIESMLLKIPIPPLYFGKLDGGKVEVIDGQQRLTTFIDFIANKFALRGLTCMPSLNGKTFKELSLEQQEKIKDTPIRTVQIDAGANTELRYEVFERLNRGSMALNEQELRNCIYRGPFNRLLSELEADSKWRKIKQSDEPEKRFKERELILRLLAFADRGSSYKGGLKRFLNTYMEKYAPKQPELIEEQKRLFKEAMQNVYNVFGPNSGRLYITPSETSKEKGGGWDKKFSIAALEIQASALWGQNPAKVQKIADQIQEHFLFFLLTNNAIQEAISKATGGSTPTKLRWTAFKAIVDPLINDVEIEPRFFSLAMRQKMYETNPICALCGNKIHALEDCAVDHITPYIRGGTTTPENGQLTHRSCNAIKHAKIPDLHP